MIQPARKVGQAAPDSFACGGKRRQHEPDRKHSGSQRPKAQGHVLPDRQRRDEPRHGIEPRTQHSYPAALGLAERPHDKAIGRQNPQRIGAQRNKKDQADEAGESDKNTGIAEEEKCHADYKEIVAGKDPTVLRSRRTAVVSAPRIERIIREPRAIPNPPTRAVPRVRDTGLRASAAVPWLKSSKRSSLPVSSRIGERCAPPPAERAT